MSEANKKVALLAESTTFTRLPGPNGEGELLEVKVTTKIRTVQGIVHDTTQSFVLSGEGANDTLASLRVIHNNIQLALMQKNEEEPAADSDNPELATASESANS